MKNGAKIHQKTIKKRGPKNDAKRVPKRALPPGGREPPRRFPSKKGTVQKNNKQTKNNNDCRKLEVQCRKSEQSTNPIPTRLGRLRPGADLSCLRQCTRSGPWKVVCLSKLRVHTVVCSGFAGWGAKSNQIFKRNHEKTLSFIIFPSKV